jgi:hypothetical protein
LCGTAEQLVLPWCSSQTQFTRNCIILISCCLFNVFKVLEDFFIIKYLTIQLTYSLRESRTFYLRENIVLGTGLVAKIVSKNRKLIFQFVSNNFHHSQPLTTMSNNIINISIFWKVNPQNQLWLSCRNSTFITKIISPLVIIDCLHWIESFGIQIRIIVTGIHTDIIFDEFSISTNLTIKIFCIH